MSPGKRRQRARKRRAKGRTRAARRTPRFEPLPPPLPGSLIAAGRFGDGRVVRWPGMAPSRALALGGGHVHLGEIPAFAIPGYELGTAHPYLVAALVGGDVKPTSLIADVLAHAVLEPDPLPSFATDGVQRSIEARFVDGQMVERVRTHAWIVLFDDRTPAVATQVGVVIADESMQHGFGPKAGRTMLPFSPVNIEPDHTAWATARPQVANFRPDRLIIGGGPDVVADFVVENITIKNRSQFSHGSGGVPAGYFALPAPTGATIDSFLSFETAGVGEDITVTVRNVGQLARQLVMTMIGTVMARIRVEVTTHADVEAAVAGILSEPLRADLRAQL